MYIILACVLCFLPSDPLWWLHSNVLAGYCNTMLQQNLPDKARKAHIFQGLQKPLISIGILCDNKCIAVFDEKRVTIYYKTTRHIVMQGHRYPTTTLYMINMAAPLREMPEQYIPDTLMVNHVYEKKPKQELTLFYHVKKCLCILARTHSGARQQVPTKNRSNHQRTHQTSIKRHANT